MRITLFTILLTVLLASCSSNKQSDYSAFHEPASNEANIGQRLWVRSASIDIETQDIDSSLNQLKTITSQYSGRIESTNQQTNSLYATLKIPTAELDTFITALHAIGKISKKTITAKDVTDSKIDSDAKLKNLIALRERYLALLAKANSVTEMIEVEKELTRLQTEIDSLQNHITLLKNQSDMATAHVQLTQKTVYGPLGYLFKGIFWGIGKLFVIR